MEELPLLCGLDYASGAAKGVPLTTPDLHLLLERMQVRTEEIKDRVFSTVTTQYKEIVELVGRASTAALDVEALHSQLQDLLQDSSLQIGPTSFDSTLWKISAEVKSLRSELSVKKSALSLARATAELRDRLLAGKELFDRAQMLEGARKIAEVKRVVVNDRENTLLMRELLKKLLSRVLSEMKALLAGLCSQAVSVSVIDGVLAVKTVTFAESKFKFVAFLETMEILGLIDDFLGHFTDALCQLLVLLVHNPATVITVDENTDSAVLRITLTETGNKPSSIVDVYQRVLDFVKFLHHHVADYKQVWMLKVGRWIWPRLADMIIHDHLRKAIPTNHTLFQDFEKIQSFTAEFEQDLHAENLFLLDEHGGNLTNFTSDVEFHFSANRRKELLAKARHMIVRFDYCLFLNMVAKSEERDQLIFKEDKYAVSYLAKQLLTIVQETLKDACSSTPRIALELYKAARDIVLLYRAIVPSQVSLSDQSILLATQIFYDDCLYIGQELVAFSEQYNSSLPGDLQQSCTFMDIVPLFQSMGVHMLSEQFKLINNQLMRALDIANGFASNGFA